MQRKMPNYKKMLNAHTQYHCRRKNINKSLNQATNKEIDRRTIQGRGTPKTEENIYRKIITYNIKINKWTCNTCGKQYDPQNQQNAIQHACKHFQKPKAENGLKWAPNKPEEEENTK